MKPLKVKGFEWIALTIKQIFNHPFSFNIFALVNTEIKLMTLTTEEHVLLTEALVFLKVLQTEAKKTALDRYLTQDQILKKFGWSYKVLERARAGKDNDKLRYTKRGNKFIYLVEDFESWLMKNYSKLEMPAEEKKKYSAGKRNF